MISWLRDSTSIESSLATLIKSADRQERNDGVVAELMSVLETTPTRFRLAILRNFLKFLY